MKFVLLFILVILFSNYTCVHFDSRSILEYEAGKNTLTISPENEAILNTIWNQYGDALKKERVRIFDAISSVKKAPFVEISMDSSYGLAMLIPLIEFNYSFEYTFYGENSSMLRIYPTKYNSFVLKLNNSVHFYGKGSNVDRFIQQYLTYQTQERYEKY